MLALHVEDAEGPAAPQDRDRHLRARRGAGLGVIVRAPGDVGRVHGALLVRGGGHQARHVARDHVGGLVRRRPAAAKQAMAGMDIDVGLVHRRQVDLVIAELGADLAASLGEQGVAVEGRGRGGADPVQRLQLLAAAPLAGVQRRVADRGPDRSGQQLREPQVASGVGVSVARAEAERADHGASGRERYAQHRADLPPHQAGVRGRGPVKVPEHGGCAPVEHAQVHAAVGAQDRARVHAGAMSLLVAETIRRVIGAVVVAQHDVEDVESKQAIDVPRQDLEDLAELDAGLQQQRDLVERPRDPTRAGPRAHDRHRSAPVATRACGAAQISTQSISPRIIAPLPRRA